MGVDKIKDILLQQKPYLNDNYYVSDIGIFGSVAKKQETEISDVDLLVKFSKPIGFFQFARLENYLANVLKKGVDLVTVDALKPAIKDRVLKEVVYV